MDVNNFGATSLSLRLLFENPMGGPPTDVAFSTIPVIVPAGSGWMSVVFPILPGNLTAESGSIITALSTASFIRLFHSPAAGFPGPAVVASLGVDNIQAAAPVPEPSAALLLGGGLLLIWRWRRARPSASI